MATKKAARAVYLSYWDQRQSAAYYRHWDPDIAPLAPLLLTASACLFVVTDEISADSISPRATLCTKNLSATLLKADGVLSKALRAHQDNRRRKRQRKSSISREAPLSTATLLLSLLLVRTKTMHTRTAMFSWDFRG